MRKGLYDSLADRWLARGGTVWLYSDPHFSDEESYSFRGFDLNSETIDELDEWQISGINSFVTDRDTLVVLGDVGDVECAKRLRGYKVLIMGNHDKGASNYKDAFDEIYEGPLTVNSKLMLSHEPMNLGETMFNIHGHTHALSCDYDDLHMNVCAEAIDYQPINLRKMIERGILKRVKNIHRSTIDEAIKRKGKAKR